MAKKTSKKATKKKASKKTVKKATKKITKKASKKTTKKASKKKAKKSSSKKPGLYANIHKAQERAKRGGKPTRKKGSEGAPTEGDFKKSEKTAKK